MYILLRCVCGFDLGASNCLIYLTIDVYILSAFWWRVVTYWRDLCHCRCYFYSFLIFSADITYMAHEHIAYVVPLNMFTLVKREVTDKVHSTSAHSLFTVPHAFWLSCTSVHWNIWVNWIVFNFYLKVICDLVIYRSVHQCLGHFIFMQQVLGRLLHIICWSSLSFRQASVLAKIPFLVLHMVNLSKSMQNLFCSSSQIVEINSVSASQG